MRQNVQKLIDRGENLSEVKDRAEMLKDSATNFQNDSRNLQRKQWWANKKMTIALGVVVGTVLIIIIIGKCGVFLFYIRDLNF